MWIIWCLFQCDHDGKNGIVHKNLFILWKKTNIGRAFGCRIYLLYNDNIKRRYGGFKNE